MAAPDETPRWDERLQRRLARGEETALGELYDQLSPMVHGLAGRVLGDQAAAARLTREVFARVWERPEDFDPAQGSLRSWLGALTHRLAVERLRARRAADLVPTRAAGGTADDPAAAEAATEAPESAEAEIRAVAAAARAQYVVESLPAPLRETITVTYYDGRTYQETARLLGISEQAAKQRMRLGLALLATELAEDATRPDRPRDPDTGQHPDTERHPDTGQDTDCGGRRHEGDGGT
ncbi:sigma-70 family RNA polymerase sigma factor [Streptomyces rubellomurinus]|uniref:sigma-70 family RNA polymerase sigma factor n=1 Tax=Streptomyces rubellomurinus (strain ATCC 31215) TaxID=359131 RepID=UPI0007C64345|nr:sigma-70 family RNA polymerase sigma factor [Streptomyces rubellomurinus]